MGYGLILGGVGVAATVSTTGYTTLRDNTRFQHHHIGSEHYIDLPGTVDREDFPDIPRFTSDIDRYSIKTNNVTGVPSTEIIDGVKYYKLSVSRGVDDLPYKKYLIHPENGKILQSETMNTVFDFGPSFSLRINSLFDSQEK